LQHRGFQQAEWFVRSVLGTRPFGPAAAPEQVRQPETPSAEWLSIAELDELASDNRQVFACGESIVIAACEPLFVVEKRDNYRMPLIDQIGSGCSERCFSLAEQAFATRGINFDALSAEVYLYRLAPPTAPRGGRE
jgi:hypothetical protein